MLVHEEEKTIVCVGGTGQANTQKFSGVLLRNIFVKTATATTTFDFSLIDRNDNIRREWTGNYGELSVDVAILLKGIYTMKISNSSVGTASYTVILSMEERT